MQTGSFINGDREDGKTSLLKLDGKKVKPSGPLKKSGLNEIIIGYVGNHLNGNPFLKARYLMVYIRKVVNKWGRVEKELTRRSQPEKK